MTAVRVRMYHVGFGDCFLVTIGAGDGARRMLIDCGRHSGSRPPGTGEKKFEQIVAQLIDDIAAEVDPPRLDVVVATHRHRDHVHGFSFADLWERVLVGEVWLPWVEDLDDPLATTVRDRQNALALRTFHALRSLRAAGEQDGMDDAIEIAYNCTTNATAFRTLRHGFHPESTRRIRYLPRQGRSPEQLNQDDCGENLPAGVVVHVLGPSRDPRVIKRLDPPEGKGFLQMLPAMSDVGPDESPADLPVGTVPRPFNENWVVPEGDVDARYELSAEERRDIRAVRLGAPGDALEMVYRIDNAVNGTSLVLVIEIGVVKLLFAGDAQWGTWEQILGDDRSRRVLRGTTLFKVGHHGSRNATPEEFVADFVDGGVTAAMVSVDSTKYKGEWQSIPKDSLLTALTDKGVTVLRSDQPPSTGGTITVDAEGLWTQIDLDAPGR